jgi:hypothetical protein
MTSTLTIQVNKRQDKLKKLQDINYIIRWENKRLQTKKDNLDVFLEKKYTICGNIQDIQNELKRLKKERKESENKKKEITKTITKNKKIYIKNKKAIARLYQLTEMEQDLDKDKDKVKDKSTKMTKNQSNPIKDEDLKKMSIILPDEVLRHIQEYFTYDTRYSLLENKYKPFKLINKFNPYLTREIIRIIFNKEIKKYLFLNSGIEDNMIQQYSIFYDCLLSDDNNNNNRLKLKRSIKHEKIFLKYIINSFCHTYPHIVYGLYKFIILLNKCKIK